MDTTPPLVEIIQEKIRNNGPVTFSWFMEQALYHPEFGYYTAPRQRIGRAGDFYTNVSVGPVLGNMLASQLLKMWEKLGRTEEFTIAEQGAEDGQLALDILSAIQSREGKLPGHLHYVIVEPHTEKQRQQRARLEPDFVENITWAAEVVDLKPITGAFISNELVDALPVRIVEFQDDHWSELLVEARGTRFEFIATGDLAPDLAAALCKLPTPTAQPYRTEVNLNSTQWIRSVAAKLKAGFVLIIDYGFPRDEYYKLERTEGTLTAYSRHRRLDNPLDDPGKIDITAHVDFTSLAEAGESAGLTLAGYTDQHHFMVGAGEADLRRLEQQVAKSGLTKHHSAFLADYRTLMHPGVMGMAFKYLLLQKGLLGDSSLSGFQYAGDPSQALGLNRGNRP